MWMLDGTLVGSLASMPWLPAGYAAHGGAGAGAGAAAAGVPGHSSARMDGWDARQVLSRLYGPKCAEYAFSKWIMQGRILRVRSLTILRSARML